MKKVLIITYHFPPDAAVGAVRPAKFAKYLPEFGWEPFIYTVKERYYESCDYSRFEPALKPLKIYRANLIPGPLHLYSRLIYKANRSLNNASPITQSFKGGSQNRINSIKRFLSSMARVPDDKQGWIFNILMGGYRIIKEHKINVFMTSGPPMSAHLGGLLLKYLTHAKWIADFRDPWAKIIIRRPDYMHTACSNTMQKWLEYQVIRKADVVVSTTLSVSEYFKLILPKNKRSKCITITNGFDESDFMGIAHSTSRETHAIKITYAGTLYLKRDPEPFFEVLSELVKEKRIEPSHIEIDFMGNFIYYKGGSIQKLIEKYDLSSMVRYMGRIPFKMSLERLMSSNALLLFAQGHPDQIPSKVFEYLRVNRPIFALTEEGETRSVLGEFENVFIADPGNPNEIRHKFLQMLEAVYNGEKYLSSEDKIRKYDRRSLTEKLAKCLDEINRK